MEPHTFIAEHEAVLSRFGEWPSFHDGEVHRLVLDSTRRGAGGGRYPSIELDVRGWIMTREVTEEGFYRCDFDSVVCFLFEEVTLVELDGLNHQNVLSCLNFELIEDDGKPKLKVDLKHCYGLSGSFVAASARVLSVTPYSKSDAVNIGFRQSWLRTEKYLRDARSAIPDAITAKHVTALNQFEDFLDNNELGLAADWLVSIAKEIPDEALTSIEFLILAERNMGRVSNQNQLEVLLAKASANKG